MSLISAEPHIVNLQGGGERRKTLSKNIYVHEDTEPQTAPEAASPVCESINPLTDAMSAQIFMPASSSYQKLPSNSGTPKYASTPPMIGYLGVVAADQPDAAAVRPADVPQGSRRCADHAHVHGSIESGADRRPIQLHLLLQHHSAAAEGPTQRAKHWELIISSSHDRITPNVFYDLFTMDNVAITFIKKEYDTR